MNKKQTTMEDIQKMDEDELFEWFKNQINGLKKDLNRSLIDLTRNIEEQSNSLNQLAHLQCLFGNWHNVLQIALPELEKKFEEELKAAKTFKLN